MNSSIDEVVRTLVEALIIVTLVVFAFLGSLRSVFIPTIAIPLSLIGTFTMMAIFGFSINLLTLLALVLAIGLVVDDAIIIVENVNRHLEEGMQPIPAAIQAARELGGPIIAMTVVLIAVYVPIGFQSGLTGALFTEFAFTLVGAVTISAIVALTLSPMMCSRLLKPHSDEAHGWEARLIRFIDRSFDRLRRGYARWLHGSLNYLPVTAVFAVIVLGSIYFLYSTTKSELAPQEDQGVIITLQTAAANATLEQRLMYSKQVFDVFVSHPGDRPCLPARGPRPIHRRHGPEALGSAYADHQPACADPPATAQQDCRRPDRGLPAAAAAGQQRLAGAIRHQHHGRFRAAERDCSGLPAGSRPERHVHLSQHRSRRSICRNRQW